MQPLIRLFAHHTSLRNENDIKYFIMINRKIEKF